MLLSSDGALSTGSFVDVQPSDLNYSLLSQRLAPITTRTGLGESASFLVWFLENVYRLEETDARDAVCDHSNDKGIDGIYVDHNNEEIHFLQARRSARRTTARSETSGRRT